MIDPVTLLARVVRRILLGRRPGPTLELIDLQCAVVDHCTALREVAEHLQAGRTRSAIARLDGAVAELERVVVTQHKDGRIRARADELKREGR